VGERQKHGMNICRGERCKEGAERLTHKLVDSETIPNTESAKERWMPKKRRVVKLLARNCTNGNHAP